MHLTPPKHRECHFERYVLLSATLLSMDCVIPFASYVGADFANHPGFVTALRGAISNVRQKGDLSHASVSASSLIVNELLKHSSTEVVKKFVWWSAFVLENELVSEFSKWKRALVRCVSQGEQWSSLGLSKMLLNQLQASIADYLAPQPMRVPSPSPRLSDWDLHLYAVNLFNDDDVAAHDPETYMYGCQAAFRGMGFWSRAENLLVDANLTLFHQAVVARLDLEEEYRSLANRLNEPVVFRSVSFSGDAG